MASDNYINIILEKIERNIGFSIEHHGISRHQWGRIMRLSEILRAVLVIEQMAKVEVKGNKPHSKSRSGKSSDLSGTLTALDKVRAEIWDKCDDIAASILYDSGNNAEKPLGPQKAGSAALRCPSCEGNITIFGYDEYKCKKCGLGYSAIDYLNIMNDRLKEI